MTIPLVVVGAGGFGRETLDVIEAINHVAMRPVFELLGVLDANPSELNRERLKARGIDYLGSEMDWLVAENPARYVIAIGDPQTRAVIQKTFNEAGLLPATLFHPDAVLGSQVAVGEGSVICGGVRISTNVTLGRHVHVNPSVTIGHDAVVESFTSLNPGAVISGDVRVQRLALVGAGAVILQGLQVGSQAVVGAAACVVNDVPANATVKGVPAR